MADTDICRSICVVLKLSATTTTALRGSSVCVCMRPAREGRRECLRANLNLTLHSHRWDRLQFGYAVLIQTSLYSVKE
jgi:hypothetical protein